MENNTRKKENEVEVKVYVAVKKIFKEGKENLRWLLQQTSGEKQLRVFITHVHVPSEIIAPKRNIPLDKVEEEEIMHKCLDDYLLECSRHKVQANKLVIEADDVARGLIQLIAIHKIDKLVMGAASDKLYTSTMNAPTSKTALIVEKHADPSCTIWFVCKGVLIRTKEASSNITQLIQPTFTSNRSRIFHAETSSANSNTNFWYKLGSFIFGPQFPPPNSINSTPQSTLITEDSRTDSDSNGILDGRSKEAANGLAQKHGKKIHFSSPLTSQEIDSSVESADKLKDALAVIENLKKELYDESQKHKKLEKITNDAIKRTKTFEKQLAIEIKLREDAEKAAADVVNKHNLILEEFQTAKKEKILFEERLENASIIIKTLKDKLTSARFLIRMLGKKLKSQKLQNDATLKEIEKLRQKEDLADTGKAKGPELFLEFSYPEIERATNGFSSLHRIGKGGYGYVYKGVLRNYQVAVKKLDRQSMQGEREFKQEVAILGKVRHPNIVTLIGACLDACVLVYEFLPNGSLADRLYCKNNTPPLSWRERSRIAVEICSALIFLHSNKPSGIVHGDLKPENILLDANNVSKLGDFGISRLLLQSSHSVTTMFHQTQRPKGTFAYIDPEFLESGILTRYCDIYSFGIVILQLITGRKPSGIVDVVKAAVDDKRFSEIIDPGAGRWPYVHVRKLANLGLKCSEKSRKDRPDLMGEVWSVLKPMMKADSLPLSTVVPDNCPDHFICPLSMDIMEDPQCAADGYTYDAKYIKSWFNEGNANSPVTNLPVPTFDLFPNLALRTEIKEWLAKYRRT